jgi:hypothetical protein
MIVCQFHHCKMLQKARLALATVLLQLAIHRAGVPLCEHADANAFVVLPMRICACIEFVFADLRELHAQGLVFFVERNQDDVFAFHGRFLFAIFRLSEFRILAGWKRPPFWGEAASVVGWFESA